MRILSFFRRLFAPRPLAPTMHLLCELAGECYAEVAATYEQVAAVLATVRPLDGVMMANGWAFEDANGRKACLWAHESAGGQVGTCTRWRVAGSHPLLADLFHGQA